MEVYKACHTRNQQMGQGALAPTAQIITKGWGRGVKKGS